MVQDGCPLLEVKEQLGHATYEMTLRYAHLAPDNRAKALRSIDAPWRSLDELGTDARKLPIFAVSRRVYNALLRAGFDASNVVQELAPHRKTAEFRADELDDDFPQDP